MAAKTNMQHSQTEKIKRLLSAYALARPRLRLAFSVFKSDRPQWVYTALTESPSVLVEACKKVFGSRIVTQMKPVTWPFDGRPSTFTGDSDGFRFEAVVPELAMSDFSAIKQPRQFLAVDQRPVSCSRGFLKQLVGQYRKVFRARLGASTEKVDPLLVLNITCPLGSYDVNIEPAKDDVLFRSPDRVLALWDAFLTEIYPEVPASDSSTARRQSPPKRQAPLGSDPWSLSRIPAPKNSLDAPQDEVNEIQSFAHASATASKRPRPPDSEKSEVQASPEPRPARQKPEESPEFNYQALTEVQETRQPNAVTLGEWLQDVNSTVPSQPSSLVFDEAPSSDQVANLVIRPEDSQSQCPAVTNPPFSKNPEQVTGLERYPAPGYADLALTLDYETRKSQAMQDYRKSQQAQIPTPPPSSPYMNRESGGTAPSSQQSRYRSKLQTTNLHRLLLVVPTSFTDIQLLWMQHSTRHSSPDYEEINAFDCVTPEDVEKWASILEPHLSDHHSIITEI